MIWKLLGRALAFVTGIDNEPTTYWVTRVPTDTTKCHPGEPEWRHRRLHGGYL